MCLCVCVLEGTLSGWLKWQTTVIARVLGPAYFDTCPFEGKFPPGFSGPKWTEGTGGNYGGLDIREHVRHVKGRPSPPAKLAEKFQG